MNPETLGDYHSLLQGWSTALTANADILIYGCDFAASSAGKGLVTQLSQLTGADVMAVWVTIH